VKGTVLITGASSGIGAAAARRLHEAGFRVFGTTRHPASLAPDAPEIEWLGMDVRDEKSVRAGVDAVLAAAARLDAVVCNAGFGIFGSVEEVTLSEARAQFDTNFFGTLATLRATLPALRMAGAGRAVLVGSLAGRAPIPFQAHYSASKAAIEALAFALANELRAFGVRVSLIEPGDIRTPFNQSTDFRPARQSIYGEAIERCRKIVEHSLDDAPAPEIVAEAIQRALSDRRPRFRYAVGREALSVALGRRLLPDRWSLRLLGRHFGV
jgi:NAD(P)-dependent dehydrogenase (short-subunit alcohol dehydrogenase family)